MVQIRQAEFELLMDRFPRNPNEPSDQWFDRLMRQAEDERRGLAEAQLPPGDREPGQEG